MRVALRMAIEQLAEEGPRRALDLRDKHDRLAHLDDVPEPGGAEVVELVEGGRLLPRWGTRAGSLGRRPVPGSSHGPSVARCRPPPG